MVRRVRKSLILGDGFIFTYRGFYPREVILIQPTEKGYNFLDVNTNKCVLKRHLYPDKNTLEKENSLLFWLNEDIWLVNSPSIKIKTNDC